MDALLILAAVSAVAGLFAAGHPITKPLAPSLIATGCGLIAFILQLSWMGYLTRAEFGLVLLGGATLLLAGVGTVLGVAGLGRSIRANK